MTEQEWQCYTDPGAMLHFLRDRTAFRTRWQGWVHVRQWRISERKLRLFACACCRRIARWFRTRESLTAIAVAELYAVGRADFSALERSLALADGAERKVIDILDVSDAAIVRASRLAFEALACLCRSNLDEVVAVVHLAACVRKGGVISTREQSEQADLLREIVGNPFTPARIDPAWLSWNDGIVSDLARLIDKDRGYADMPILADALIDAGCRDEVILGHCRGGDARHAPGCWVLDLLLGKE